MTEFPHRLTRGYVLQHVPPGGNVGLDIAILDISQDFLLGKLAASGFFELAVFKGGTSIRKLYAGPAGRFSTDLDFGLIDRSLDRETVADLLVESVNGLEASPFRFSAERRHQQDRWKIRVESEYGSPPQTMKVDIGPPVWLQPDSRQLVATNVHKRYDFALPAIPTMAFAETIAEKIARLNRRSTARDAYDLVWTATTTPHSSFDRDLVRRLSILKIWGDANGLGGAWAIARGDTFDPAQWLRVRDDWDDEGIGLLASPTPKLSDLDRDLRKHYNWMSALTTDEQRWAGSDSRHQTEVIAAIGSLPRVRITPEELWMPPDT